MKGLNAGPDPQVKHLEGVLEREKQEKEILLSKIATLEKDLRGKDEEIQKKESALFDPVITHSSSVWAPN